MASGEGSGRGDSILWFIVWLLVLIFIAFEVAIFISWFYIILLPVTVCVPDLKVVTDLLLKVVQFPYYCCGWMMNRSSLKEVMASAQGGGSAA